MSNTRSIGRPVNWVHRGDFTRKTERWMYTRPQPQVDVGAVINTVIMLVAMGGAIVVGMHILTGL